MVKLSAILHIYRAAITAMRMSDVFLSLTIFENDICDRRQTLIFVLGPGFCGNDTLP